jgi:hypothetical protein
VNGQSSEDDRSGGAAQTAHNAPMQSPAGDNQSIDRKTSAQPRQDKESNGIPRKWEIGIGAFLAVVNFAALFIYGYRWIDIDSSNEPD